MLWGGTSVLKGTFDIDDQSVADGMRVIESYLKENGDPIFDAVAIERERWRLALASAARFSSNHQVARALFTAWKLNWPPSSLDELPAQLAAVTASDLEAALRACRASAVVSVVAAVGARW